MPSSLFRHTVDCQCTWSWTLDLSCHTPPIRHMYPSPRISERGGVGRFLSKLHQPGRIPSSALPIPQTPFPRFRRCYTRVFLLSCFLFWCHFTFALHRRGRMRLSRPFYSTPLMHRHSRPWYSDRQPPTNTRIKAPTAPKNTSPPAPRTYITDLAISKP